MLKRGRTRPSDVGGGSDDAVRRRCCARWRDSGEGFGEESALRLAMLGDREVVEEVLSDCEDIVLHGERAGFGACSLWATTSTTSARPR